MYNRQLKSIQLNVTSGRGAVTRAEDRWALSETWETHCYPKITPASIKRISKLSYKDGYLTSFQAPNYIFVEKVFN